MQYEPDQIKRYVGMAAKDVDGIFVSRTRPTRKKELSVVLSAFCLAAKSFVAHLKRVDYNKVSDLVNEKEVLTLVSKELKMTTLSNIYKAAQHSLRGSCPDRFEWEYADGKKEISPAEAKKMVPVLKEAVKKIQKLTEDA